MWRGKSKMPKHICNKFTGYTALSSTDAQTLGGADLGLPDGAKSILAVIPYITSPAGCTANEAIVGKVSITSTDVGKGLNPINILAQPIGSQLQGALAVGQPQGGAKGVIYPINCNINGGEDLTIKGQGLINHTIEPYMGVEVIYSDLPAHKAQRYYKVGTYTNTGTSAATVIGSTIKVTGGKTLVEVNGFAVGTTVATLKGLCGYFIFTSEGLSPSWIPELPINPASGGVGTDLQETIAGLARRKIQLDMDKTVTIQDDFHLSVALTTTGNFIAGVGYTKRGDQRPI